MGKYESLRKSQAARHSAHSLTPGLNYVPTVCRAVLEETGPAVQAAEAFDSNPVVAFQDPAGSWDLALSGLEDDFDEPLPVPELEDETRIVARAATMQPIQMPLPVMMKPVVTMRAKAPIDPLAMLEAATIRNVPRPRR